MTFLMTFYSFLLLGGNFRGKQIIGMKKILGGNVNGKLVGTESSIRRGTSHIRNGGSL